MNEICETVLSQKGGTKINVHDYLMTLEFCCKNNYYWACDKKKNRCKGRAVTQLYNNIYYLKQFTIHEFHAPESHNAEVAKFSSEIKRQARETPSKIIQENIINTPEAIRLYLSSTNACHRKIQHVRHAGLPP
ncbi:23935_t:CDS:1 [Dentiscutata erythropus]|uniref:23935_t:CDS:1 n=1 Tax=Dentiscutata erythropus TaxID=1348616 RepID=A0A9N9K3U4_9GLOM|nr:23935_t:CDS:1 [Dentiscutata erythropus]